MLVNSYKEYFMIISKDRAHRLYKEVYNKCIWWLEKFLAIGSKKTIWKLVVAKNEDVSTRGIIFDQVQLKIVT